MSIESVIPSNHLILCRPLLLPSNLPSIKVFSNESALRIRWPKYWSFSFSISEYSGLISFKIDWFDLLAVQGTLKSLLQHHNSKASILGCSAFFVVYLSHPYMTTGKTRVLTISIVKWCLCFLVHCLPLPEIFFPRSKCLNFMAVVIATLVKVSWRLFGQVFCPLGVQEVPTSSIPLCDMIHSYSYPEVMRDHMDDTFKMAERKGPVLDSWWHCWII